MGRRYGSLPDPYVPEVASPDFVQLESRALSNALNTARFEEAGREIRGRTALDDAMKRWGGNEQQALDDITQGGHGAFAMTLRGGAMDRQKKRLENSELERSVFAKLVPTIKDQQSLDSAVRYWESITGRKVPDEYRTFTPDLPSRLQGMQYSAMSPEQQASLKLREEANARERELQPGRVESQRLGNENTRSILEQRREEGPLRIAEREAKVAQLQREKEGWQTIHKETDPVDGRVSGVLERNSFTGKYRRIDPATGQEVPFGQEQAPAAPQGSGDQPPVAGAKKAPDGKWYVQQNGKWFRVD
jgi:hypothetical protein